MLYRLGHFFSLLGVDVGYFGTVNQGEFDEFRRSTSERFDSLNAAISHRVGDSEEVAKAAALNAQAIELRLKTAELEVNNLIRELTAFKEEATNEVASIKTERSDVGRLNLELHSRLSQTDQLHADVLNAQTRINEAEQEVAQKVAALTSYINEGQHLPASVEAVKQLLATCGDSAANINSLYEHAIKRKKEIDSLHKEIYGEDHSDNSGNIEHVDGIKDHLENSYKTLVDSIQGLDRELLTISDQILGEHRSLLDNQREQFSALIERSNRKVVSVQDQLTALLPGAMAEGLSAAYEKKKEDEVLSLKAFEMNFKGAIMAMVGVSMIPLAIDLHLVIVQSKDFVQVIKDTPGLIVAIFPLYFPILWMAHSSNKKYNLSKRLIEEYTHKAVLGKTFSGLSHQIDSIQQQGTIKDELRNRLLHNVLQVSAENPGKLITDYQKSDHPLMEALESSVKLADAVTKLSKVPGFASMAKRIAEKGEKLSKDAELRVAKGLDDQELIEKRDEEK